MTPEKELRTGSRAPRPWIRLDNAAKIFPSVMSDRITHLFRLAARLEIPVDPQVLEKALREVTPRFPPFQVQLKAGFFWYSLVEETSPARIYPETTSPCLKFRRQHRDPHLFRVRWFGRRIAVEFSHTLTDAVGGLSFLKALTAEYLYQTGVHSGDPEDVRRVRSAPDPAEGSDDFQNLFDPTFPGFKTWDKAFRPSDGLLPKGNYAVTTGRIPVNLALAAAKEYKVTLTEYLTSVLMAAYQDVFLDIPAHERRRKAKPIRIVLPVNLRPVFPSRTLRNFFVVVPVEIDLRLGAYDFPEILRKVHHQLQAEMDPKLLKKQVMRNLRGELNPVGRILPLPLKNLLLAWVYGSFERQHTGSLSNLGVVDFPEPWKSKMKDLEFTPPPSPHCPVNVGVVSFRDTLSVTFGSLTELPSVERAFFTRLRKAGLPVYVESNRPYLEV